MNSSKSGATPAVSSQDTLRSRKLVRKPQDYNQVLDENDRTRAIMIGYDNNSNLNRVEINGDRDEIDVNEDSSDDDDLEVNIDLVISHCTFKLIFSLLL